MNGPLTWLTSLTVGIVTMVLIQTTFRTAPSAQIAPIAQAFAFVAAWATAWPYANTHWSASSGLWGYLAAGIAPAFVIAALRIALKTG